MKRRALCMILALVMLMISACGIKSADELRFDIDDFASDMASDLTFDDLPIKVSDSEITEWVDLEEGVSAVMYLSDGADSFAIFECADTDIMDEQLSNIKYSLKRLKNDLLESPAKKKVDKAVIMERGYYIFVCVSVSDTEARNYIEEKLNVIQIGDTK